MHKLLTETGLKKWLMSLLVSLAIMVQLASVTMPADLEIYQTQVGMPGSRYDFRLGQRLINIACLVNPTWSNRCIDRNPTKKQFVQHLNHLAFFPFTVQQQAKHNPDVNKFVGILFWFWILVLSLAISTTIWFWKFT